MTRGKSTSSSAGSFTTEVFVTKLLLCPVRNCRLPLVHEKGCVVCARGHSFDIARSRYINLLQPQDRRSSRPGDSAPAVAARRRLHDLGVTRPLLDAVAETLIPLPSDVVLDAGCGDGYYLGTLARQMGFSGQGVDISVPAIEAAARRYPECEWIVANADRLVPYSDGSFTALISITARMNSGEFRRVLRDDGRLLVGLPATDDLIELRGAGRDRTARTIASFADDFTLTSQRRVTATADLDAATVHDVLVSIYRPLRSRPAKATRVTFSLDLLLFRPKLLLGKANIEP